MQAGNIENFQTKPLAFTAKSALQKESVLTGYLKDSKNSTLGREGKGTHFIWL